MFRVVLGAFEHPEVRLHGLLAARGVALGEERCLVGVDLHEIFRTEAYGASDCREACTSCELIGQRRCRAFHLAADIHAVTIAARGSRYAVRTKEHFLAGVLTALARF